jgi:glycerate 2-kinase
MSDSLAILRNHARGIWQAGVDAVRACDLVRQALSDTALPLHEALREARRIVVVGTGKAGAAMSAGVEETLADDLDRVEGVVNVPAQAVRPLRAIRLHAARPSAINQPTREGVIGAHAILDLVSQAGPQDVVLCLLSGGGSALLPAPVEGITLEDKQAVTLTLHASGATINEMNAVRKHLSKIKGGRLAQVCKARALFSLIISDVIGDPLDVIASGPTAADPTRFADALAVLERYHLSKRVPATILEHLRQGTAGAIPETPKRLPDNVHNLIIGNNQVALTAAQRKAEELGYRALNLGSYLEGDTRYLALAQAGIMRGILHDGVPLRPPMCLLSGGETTVALPDEYGLGGRNQEFVLALIDCLPRDDLRRTVVLSGGTDGEDGPTDAAGAIADERTLDRATQHGLNPAHFLNRHDAYHFFQQTGDLLMTGLTETNVMDVRVILVAAASAV